MRGNGRGGVMVAMLGLVLSAGFVSCAGVPANPAGGGGPAGLAVAEIPDAPAAPDFDEGAARRARAARRFERERLDPLYSPAERAGLGGVALLIIDMQAGMMPVMNAEAVFAGLSSLVERSDRAGAPVAWGYMDEFGLGMGTPEFELAAPLVEGQGHYPFIKGCGNSFNGSGLAGLFDRAGVGTVVVCGMSSGGCVDATVKGALALGYRVVVPSDTHTEALAAGAQGEIDYRNRAWARMAGVEVKPSAEVAF